MKISNLKSRGPCKLKLKTQTINLQALGALKINIRYVSLSKSYETYFDKIPRHNGAKFIVLSAIENNPQFIIIQR